MPIIRVRGFDAALARVGLDLGAFASMTRLTPFEAEQVASGRPLKVAQGTAERVAATLDCTLGSISEDAEAPGGAGETRMERDEEVVVQPQPARATRTTLQREDTAPADGVSPFERALDDVCAEGGYSDEEKDLVVQTMGAGTFPTNLTRAELPAFARAWLTSARAVRAENSDDDGGGAHRALLHHVRENGPRAAARMADGILKRLAEMSRTPPPKAPKPAKEPKGKGKGKGEGQTAA